MGAKVISFLNQKGGCGKTTCAVSVAAMLASKGHRVELINLDPQGTAIDWAEARSESSKETTNFRVSSMGANIQKDLGGAKMANDFIIVDGAPQATKLTVAAIKASDLVIIPLQATQADAWATDSTVDFINEVHEMREKEHPKAAFLPTRVLKSSKEARSFADNLEAGYSESGEYPFTVLKSRTTQRMAYQRAFEGGGSILDLDTDDQARFEINMLTKEIIELTKGL